MTDAQVSEPVDASDDAPPRHPVLAVLVTAAAGVLVALTAATVFSLAAEYGSSTSTLGGALVWSLLPGAVLAIGLRQLFQTFAARTVGWAPLLLAGYLVAVVVIGVGAVLGNARWESDRTNAASACTDGKVATLTSIPGYDPAIGTPAGQGDGSCAVTIAIEAEPDVALAQFIAAMKDDGWAPGKDSDYDAWFARAGVLVGVDQRGSGKGYTDFTVLVPAG